MSERALVSQKELEHRVMRALFDYAQDGADWLNRADVTALLENEFSEVRIKLALEVLDQAGLVRSTYSTYGTNYQISSQGYLDVEQSLQSANIESVASEPAVRLSSPESTPEWLPASDRLVPINHNSLEYIEVKDRLGEVREIIRTSNDLELEPSAKDGLLNALDAAASLWRSAELTYFQIKVGVLLAAQQAWAALKKHSRAIAAALLVDAIKAFLKTHLSIDLDAI